MSAIRRAEKRSAFRRMLFHSADNAFGSSALRDWLTILFRN